MPRGMAAPVNRSGPRNPVCRASVGAVRGIMKPSDGPVARHNAASPGFGTARSSFIQRLKYIAWRLYCGAPRLRSRRCVYVGHPPGAICRRTFQIEDRCAGDGARRGQGLDGITIDVIDVSRQEEVIAVGQ